MACYSRILQYFRNANTKPQAQSDKLKKQICNCAFLTLYLAVIFIIRLSMALGASYDKLGEIISSVSSSLAWLLIALVLNAIAAIRFRHIGTQDKRRAYRHYVIRRVGVASAAWFLYLVIGFFIGVTWFYASFAGASLIYLLYVLFCNFVLRRRIVEKNFCWERRYTVAIVLCVSLLGIISYMQRDTYYLQGYINQLPRLQQNTVPIEYREDDGVFELHMTDNEFRILQLTDIHFGGSISSFRKDKLAMEAIYREIEHTRPDLVVITGDLTFPMGIMSMSLNNSSCVSQFAAFMRNINIPWVFTFGNHDTEFVASMSEESLCGLYRSLSYKTSGTLLYPYTQPDITGRNNQVIELYNPDGSLNHALFLIDSNAYTGEGVNEYDYIHDDQVAWYEREIARLTNVAGKIVPSMAFFHIPLQEYRDAYELYLAGDSNVTYHFGRNDEKSICCSVYPCSFFEKVVELDSTKALFCGHDHYNNISLTYKEIRLTYGMSIDYLAMPGIQNAEKQRGGTLITIYSDSTFDIEQIPLSSIMN